jgi:hypothetical protein
MSANSSAVAVHANAIEQARSFTKWVCEDFTPDEALRGKQWELNHLVWLLGHLAVAQRRLVFWYTKGEERVPPGWWPIFGHGSRKMPAVLYPSLAEVRGVLDEGHLAAMEAIRSWSDRDLERPTAHVLAPLPFFKTWGDMLRQCALHESQHGGQILSLRKLLGKRVLA